MRRRRNYLNNRDLMIEINKSKMAYTELLDEQYFQYDIIVTEDTYINHPMIMHLAKINKAARLSAQGYANYIENLEGKKTKKVADFKVEPDTISDEEIVVRVITYEHIPTSDRKKKPRNIAEQHVALNFTPFKHYALIDGVMKEVGRSHSVDGEFNLNGGKIYDTLVRMLMELVNRYGQKTNWRGYTYLDDMKGTALMQLSSMCLKFDEHKSNNPFSYYTTSIDNSFKRIVNIEKEHQTIRDDLLQNAGQTPSFTRQLADEEAIRKSSGLYDEWN